MIKGIFLGSIGVLAETSDLQRRAFNLAFMEAGLDWKWTAADYREMLKISGGKNRISDFAKAKGTMVDVERLYASKEHHFEDLVVPGSLTPRAGIRRSVAHCRRNEIRLGFVTSTTREQVDLIFLGLNGQMPRMSFDYVGHSGRVARPKPAPDIYIDALQALDLRPEDVLAVEDSPQSADSALAAGLEVIGFPGANHVDRAFPRGVRVVEELNIRELVRELA